ncbi:ammonium transporter [Burkholderia glumae]|nr:hypothetical protein CEQ24_023780 [Burkholderia glumae]QGA38213.1 hypothetical protein GAS19_11700 [Burkholderia glumae]QHP89500.1 ammonium transporter [Burkholderia glumae]RQZ65254.1 ammonium transporter [Burkholderia glumae]UVS84981.1 ammonium transporter [Burkholderia glumae]
MQRSATPRLAAGVGGARTVALPRIRNGKPSRLGIAANLSLAGNGALAGFATRIDPVCGRVDGRHRQR